MLISSILYLWVNVWYLHLAIVYFWAFVIAGKFSLFLFALGFSSLNSILIGRLLSWRKITLSSSLKRFELLFLLFKDSPSKAKSTLCFHIWLSVQDKSVSGAWLVHTLRAEQDMSVLGFRVSHLLIMLTLFRKQIKFKIIKIMLSEIFG